jgi:Zn-dependent protease
MLWVAAAGPFVNFLMALGWALLFRLAAGAEPGAYSLALLKMADAGIQINVVLMALNLLPIPPLDGGRIAVSLLPDRLAWQYARLEPYGFPILLVLLFTGVLGTLLWPLIAGFRYLLSLVFGF